MKQKTKKSPADKIRRKLAQIKAGKWAASPVSIRILEADLAALEKNSEQSG